MTPRDPLPLRASETVYLAWHDGMLGGTVQTPEFGWHHIRLHWWSEDFRRRVFVATPIPEAVMAAFLARTDPFLHRGEGLRSAVAYSEELAALIAEFDRLAEASTEVRRLLLSDPCLKTGLWMEWNEVLHQDGTPTEDPTFWNARFDGWLEEGISPATTETSATSGER